MRVAMLMLNVRQFTPQLKSRGLHNHLFVENELNVYCTNLCYRSRNGFGNAD